jgi:mannosyltransferase OCH1-like enzyme
MIPRQIHFVYHDFGGNPVMPLKWQKNLQLWKKTHPNFQINLWDEEKSNKLLHAHFPQYVNYYNNLQYPNTKIDVMKYCILYVHGGVYCDLDIKPNHNIETLLKLYEVNSNIHIGYPENPLTPNNIDSHFMFSKPRQSFWLDVLKTIKQNENKYYLTNLSKKANITGANNFAPNLKKYKKHIVVIPNSILDSRMKCEIYNNKLPHFGYITDSHDQTWLSPMENLIHTKIWCNFDQHTYNYIILVLILFCVIIGLLIYIKMLPEVSIKSNLYNLAD